MTLDNKIFITDMDCDEARFFFEKGFLLFC